jgi:hypothetical protein
MISTKQDHWYWREWGKVVRYCRAHHQAEPDRHAIHRGVCGEDRSHKDFDQEDFELVIADFLALSEPANLLSQLRLRDGARKRLLYRVQRLAPPNYTAKIAEGRFRTTDLSSLDHTSLLQLRNTLAARSNSLRRRQRVPGGAPGTAGEAPALPRPGNAAGLVAALMDGPAAETAALQDPF